MNNADVRRRPTTTAAACTTGDSRWPIQRILFLLAGTVTLTGVTLGALANPWFLLLPILTGLNQLLFVAAGWCPMSLLLRQLGATDNREASLVVAAH